VITSFALTVVQLDTREYVWREVNKDLMHGPAGRRLRGSATTAAASSTAGFCWGRPRRVRSGEPPGPPETGTGRRRRKGGARRGVRRGRAVRRRWGLADIARHVMGWRLTQDILLATSTNAFEPSM